MLARPAAILSTNLITLNHKPYHIESHIQATHACPCCELATTPPNPTPHNPPTHTHTPQVINSRLFTTVRDSLGLTYDVSFEVMMFDRVRAGECFSVQGCPQAWES